ncbi:MAG: NAD(P)-dependent oxidoreductase [Pseudomonadales bacterium]|jgi:3-hydroxyisobutyrate dehydrogenase-like beta-hydroxyacid dehydrogenase|nr:NAD(P)-dependent oxidoreductase [Pseudomonadales bacterium]MDP6473166.1 NAD(P)-dependent oxidoreductase [Pseudomonadales bacterium]MDP6826077.1 NAD(P)-dependent oxidoreductase [Pseudomonadales bacterium]MDP6970390.1 NAD(P)-dependent oxidoreductase [Pseudomonadales bacterium]|tara:strand:- start:542 stop:1411 length:870 start_codon:yes stop_codon:yes gene_type:complete
MTQTVAFIGLGVMGYPMAGHLAGSGLAVQVFNRTVEVRERWVAEHGGVARGTPAEAAAGAEFVFMCVGNDDDLREVSLGADGVLSGMGEGSVLIDHTSVSAEVARELDEAARGEGVGFLDAPVSGGQAGAENGHLTIMVGGAPEVYARAEGLMDCYARMVKLMGTVGAGQLTKMVNQICIAGVLQGLSEAIDFAARAGLDPDTVVEVISKGAAQSWQMENRAPTMARDEFEFGFAVDWMRKDLEIALRTGRRLDARLPLTALVDQFYADVQAAGGGRWDTSSLITRLRD